MHSDLICRVIYIYNCFHLKKGLYSRRREFNKVMLRAVSHIVLFSCRLIYSQHYAPYEHIYTYIYMTYTYCAYQNYMYVIALINLELVVFVSVATDIRQRQNLSF